MSEPGTYPYVMEQPVEDVPTRVLSLAPCLTESLADLGFAHAIIGFTDDCVLPEGSRSLAARLGPAAGLDIERAISLRPDLAIVNVEFNSETDIEALQRAGIPVWVTFPKTVRQTFNLLWSMMHVFDDATMVERVRSMEWTCDWLERMDESRLKRPSVFVALGLEPLITISGDTYASDLLRLCGADSIFAGDLSGAPDGAAMLETRYPQADPDAVRGRNPDLCLVAENAGSPERLRAVLGDTLGRIAAVDSSLLTWPGTRVGFAMQALPSLLIDE